jgi:hypothetical protein
VAGVELLGEKNRPRGESNVWHAPAPMCRSGMVAPKKNSLTTQSTFPT